MPKNTNYDIAVEPLLNDWTRFQPISGYQISDQEVGATSYYGYENKAGEWYIMKSVIAGAVTSYRYRVGSSGYATGWAGRAAGAAYDYFEDVF